MRTLSVPSVLINNVSYAIVPNSFRYSGGEGEQNVRAASGGGDNIESVHSSNAETKIGKVMFDAYLTSDLDGKISTLKRNIGQNSVSATERFNDGTAVVRAWDRMSLTNDVERTASADGVVPFEFSGDPMSVV